MGLGSCASTCGNEAASLLTWSMLAACTVGPGTVITCARAGAEDNLVLMWCLVAASIVAYILQEESGRLTMVSGSSFGHVLRVKFAPSHCSHSVPAVRYSSLVPRLTVHVTTIPNCRTDSRKHRRRDGARSDTLWLYWCSSAMQPMRPIASPGRWEPCTSFTKKSGGSGSSAVLVLARSHSLLFFSGMLTH